MLTLRLILTLWLFRVAQTLPAQSVDRSFPQVQGSFAGVYLPITDRQLGGVSLQVIYQHTPRFGTGVRVVATRVRIGETLGYTVQDPRLTLLQFGWFNQWRLLRFGRVAVFGTGQASVLLSQLGDWADKRYTGRGGYVARTVATDAYLTLEPGLRTTCAVTDRLSLSASASYAFAVGSGGFSTARQFTAPLAALGLQLTVPLGSR